jgi:exodeoxyribonuclease VII small subunit
MLDGKMAIDKFEVSLKKLEEIVKKLEGGSLSLEESLKAFEEGVKHSAFCSGKLDEAERRVEILLKQKDGSLKREPFETEDN